MLCKVFGFSHAALPPVESDDEYSDDMSWKERRSSVCRGIRRDLLVELYGSVAPTLLARFKEREENVKTDIFVAFVALLKQTRPSQGLITTAAEPGVKEDQAITLLKKQVICFVWCCFLTLIQPG